jgi:hypothetical protein
MTRIRQRRATGGLGTPSQLSMARLATARFAAARARRQRGVVAGVGERSAISSALPRARRTSNRSEEAMPDPDDGPSPRTSAHPRLVSVP